LPDLEHYSGSESSLNFPTLFTLAGDTKFNESLNASMTSGESVARLIAERLK
jgi:hypothetical protein